MCLLVLAFSSLGVQGASSIAQSFETQDNNVVSGALVSLKGNSANTVELSTTKNLDLILGIAGEDSLIELSSGTGTVQVVTSGETMALVSDINGAVQTGDKITASPVAGVGMKAVTSTLIIGTAQADLADADTDKKTITDKGGDERSIQIGAIPIQVDKVFYEAPQDASMLLPPALQDLAANIAGKQVSPIRVLLATLLVFTLFMVIAVLLYSAVHSSIISIGRNPLSEAAIHKSLLRIGLIILGISVFTVVVVYLILST